MLTLHDLLEDSIYKQFFRTIPKRGQRPHPSLNPWRVYVQRNSDGSWARRDFHTYRDAYSWLRPRLGEVHDAAIQSKGFSYGPPTKLVKVTKGGKPLMQNGSQVTRLIKWKPKLEPTDGLHTWCCYCRRPTVFRYFTKHHAFPGGVVYNTGERRCTICGAAISLVGTY